MLFAKRSFLWFLLLFTLPGAQFGARAQGMAGRSLSDYNGLDRLQVNPAAMSNTRRYAELRLAGGHLFFQNNMAWIPGLRFPYLPVYKQISDFIQSPTDFYGSPDPIFYPLPGNRDKNARLNVRANAPSFMWIQGRYGFAFSQSYRFATSLEKLPNDVSHMIFTGRPTIPDKEYTHDKPFRFALAGWAEWGLSFSMSLFPDARHQISAGITAKYLAGTHGAWGQSNFMNYSDQGGHTLEIHSIYANAAMSLPVSYGSNSPYPRGRLFNGSGYAFDAGIMISRPLHDPNYRRGHIRQTRFAPGGNAACEYEYTPYKYRLGLSLTDAGSIRFNHHLRYMSLNGLSSAPGQSFEWENISGIDAFFDELARYFSTETDSILTSSREFRIGTPAAIRFQADYNTGRGVYLHAVWEQALRLTSNGLYAPSFITLSPRFEHRLAEISFPVTLYGYRTALVGLSVRVGGITLGTENLAGLAGNKDLTGTDFYFSYSLGLFKGKCSPRNAATPDCLR